MRSDISALPKDILHRNIADMDAVLREWRKIKHALDAIKNQVEIAMEWEELWNHVLGAGIGQEMDNLARLVFEMEEKRHEAVSTQDSNNELGPSVAVDELRTVVENSPSANHSPVHLPKQRTHSSAKSPDPMLQSSSLNSHVEDSLLALFARMQPLRASLDFLPMRLSVFHTRGNAMFPSACLALDARCDALEAQWRRLDADAEALRRELGEDRWLLVFRNAGKQALNMCESVSRTMDKLSQAIDVREQQTDAPAVARKIESYEAKKTHYGPAIERVLAIVDRGVLDRLTVNGEILRLQYDMKRTWTTLQANMLRLDSTLLDLNVNMRNQQLRDSISTILSSEQSIASSLVETPRSSSASSVSALSSFDKSATPRRKAANLFKSSIPRSVPGTTTSSPLVHLLRPISPTLAPVPFLRQFKPPSDKPRWNGSTSTRGSGIGLNFVPEAAYAPSASSSPRSFTPRSAPSKIPGLRSFSHSVESPSARDRSPLGCVKAPGTPTFTRHVSTPLANHTYGRAPSSVGDRAPRLFNASSSAPHLRAFTSPASARRNNLLAPTHANDGDAGAELRSEARKLARAPSALAVPSGRKSALNPQPETRDMGGRHSRADGRIDGLKGKPRWK